jgi:ABC-type dipeptide/oligopeptide/nickel transport systems, permease components
MGRTAAILRVAGWAGLGLLLVAMFFAEFLGDGTAAALLPPSDSHPFGTDSNGTDVLSQTLHGLANTGRLCIFAALIAILAGGIFGAVAARLPAGLSLSLRRLFGIVSAVPALLLTILLAGLCGHGFAAIAAGLAAAPLGFVRSFDRAMQNASFSDMARATGIPPLALLRRDLTYEFRALIADVVARALAAVAITLSTASFLGFGTAAPGRDLGAIIAAAKPGLYTAWWTAAFPALALVLFILCARLAAGLEEGERP